MRFLNYFIFLMVFFCVNAFAATPSPMTMLQSTSDQMINRLHAEKTTIKNNPQKVFNIVNEILLPRVDRVYMSKSVVGRTAWTAASPADQNAFITQFTELLIRTYASALASYSNQTVEFFPLRSGYEGQTQVTVQSQILQPGGPAIPVSYHLLLEGNEWKVIDFSVDNVSIVENYRAQFANDLSQSGLKALTQKLVQHNQAIAKGKAKP
jgi:phospholipid transport system substrate-binding protein